MDDFLRCSLISNLQISLHLSVKKPSEPNECLHHHLVLHFPVCAMFSYEKLLIGHILLYPHPIICSDTIVRRTGFITK